MSDTVDLAKRSLLATGRTDAVGFRIKVFSTLLIVFGDDFTGGGPGGDLNVISPDAQPFAIML